MNDFERLILNIMEDLISSIESVNSMAQGGEYEDTRIWSAKIDLEQLRLLLEGRHE